MEKTQLAVLQILDACLSLRGRALSFDRNTALMGALPELDSMAVVNVLTTLEETFGTVIDDDDIDGSTFMTVGSLVDFVRTRNAG